MRRLVSKLFIFLLCVLLVSGNSLKIIPILGLFGSINAGEIGMYALAALMVPLYWRRLFTRPLYTVTMGAVLTSLSIGLYKWSFEPAAALYAVRLLMQITVTALAGNIFYEMFADDALRLATGMCRIYFYLSALSIIILVLFPDSVELWAALDESGVGVIGDPHLGRLVSTYFDPNYFSDIIALPIALAWNIYVRRPSRPLLLYAVGMSVADALTFSRSGMALLVLMAAATAATSLNIRNLAARLLKYSLVALSGVLPLIVSMFVFPDFYDRVLFRFTDIGEDDSALARLDSFNVGMKLIAEEPLAGFGYNYALRSTVALRGIGLDSSIQVLVLNFGLILSTVAFFAGAVWFLNTNRFVRKLGLEPASVVWKQLSLYVILSLLWASIFNQLLFYVWWVLPVATGLFYFDRLRAERKMATRPVRAIGALPQPS